MAFWKLLITLIITAFVVLTILSAFPAARQVFHVGDLPSIDLGPLFQQAVPAKQAGNMTFSVGITDYKNTIKLELSNVSMALITNSASLQLRDGTITGKKSMIIDGFTGSFVLGKENLTLDGAFNRLELTDLGVVFKDSVINGSGQYWSVTTTTVQAEKIVLENATGSVAAKGAVVRVENSGIVIAGMNATIYADATLALNGYARSIALPDSDIEIK